MLLLGMAGFFNDFVMPAAWAGCMDIGGRHSGTVSGTMNMIGNIGGALSPMLVGYILTWSPDNWALTFYVSSGDLSPGRRVLALHRRVHAARRAVGSPLTQAASSFQLRSFQLRVF